VAWWNGTNQTRGRTETADQQPGNGIPAWRNPSTDGNRKSKKNKKKKAKAKAKRQAEQEEDDPPREAATAGGRPSTTPSASPTGTAAAARGDSTKGARAQKTTPESKPVLGAEVDLEALRTHLSTLRVVVGNEDPDVKSLAARIEAEQARRQAAAEASEAEDKAKAERKAKPPSVVKAQNKHRGLVAKRDRAQQRVAQRRKALEAAQAELDSAMAALLTLEEKVLVAEADMRTAMHQLEAELDGRALDDREAPEVQVITSSLENRMASLLRTMCHTANSLLASTSTDAMAMRQQVSTWVAEISQLPLQAKIAVKTELKEADHAKGAVEEVDRDSEPPPSKQRRRDPEGKKVSPPTDDERGGWQSAGSMADAEVLTSDAEEARTSAAQKAKVASEVHAGRTRSRSPH
jgi:hypothetical protein